jgi:flagellar biogenesis protein FliO
MDTNKKKKKKFLTKEKEEKKMPKKHPILKVILILFIISLLIGGTYVLLKYIESKKQQSYIKGGNDALNDLIDEAKINGGVVLKNGESVILLSLYEKEIGGLKTNISPNDSNTVNSSRLSEESSLEEYINENTTDNLSDNGSLD